MRASDPFQLSDADIDRLIADDLPCGDLTTRLAGIGNVPARIVFSARDDSIVSGIDEAMRIFEKLGAKAVFSVDAGSVAPSGTRLLVAEGEAQALIAGWKIAQVLMEWASGIATATGRIVDAAKSVSPKVRVVCTRKTVPFTKALALKAVLAGGAEPHRVGLSDSILLFAEHRMFLDAADDLAAAIAALRARAPEQTIMLEVHSVAEALTAAAALADVIQLEKLAPAEVRAVADGIAKRPDGRPVIAVAGGINASNAAEYAASGADVLVTSAPYYAKPTDIQVRFEKN